MLCNSVCVILQSKVSQYWAAQTVYSSITEALCNVKSSSHLHSCTEGEPEVSGGVSIVMIIWISVTVWDLNSVQESHWNWVWAAALEKSLYDICKVHRSSSQTSFLKQNVYLRVLSPSFFDISCIIGHPRPNNAVWSENSSIGLIAKLHLILWKLISFLLLSWLDHSILLVLGFLPQGEKDTPPCTV